MSELATAKVSLLDYGAGNVRSLRYRAYETLTNIFSNFRILTIHYLFKRNAIRALGFEIEDISTPEEIATANLIVFPGVGSFGQAMQVRPRIS